jgi:hypothetical protein
MEDFMIEELLTAALDVKDAMRKAWDRWGWIPCLILMVWVAICLDYELTGLPWKEVWQ